MFKASFHCVWPMVCINKASLIGSMLDELAIPPTADRKVYADGRRLFRVIGSRKQSNSDSYLQPYGPVLPFHSGTDAVLKAEQVGADRREVRGAVQSGGSLA